MDYLAPDYYRAFRCKIAQCRAPCCDGWPVTFSMSDYFRLLGVACSPGLKRRLDSALHFHRAVYPGRIWHALAALRRNVPHAP